MGWLAKHWRGVGGTLLLLQAAWRGVHSIIMLGGDVDFVVSRSGDPGWVGKVLALLVNPPGWAILPLIIVGFALIRWDYRRSHVKNATSISAIPVGAYRPTAMSETSPYVPVRHLDGADHDLIALEKPIRIRATKTSDYTDVSVDLIYKNRSQHSLWLKAMGTHLSVDGKMPPKPGGSISIPFNSERTAVSPMGIVRIYSNASGKSGVVSFSILFGLSEKTARTIVNFKYIFKVISEPTVGNKDEKLEFQITQDLTSYEIIESEAQKLQ